MGTVYSKPQIREQLRATVAQGAPIIAAGSASGIAAKCAALAGADLIIASSLGLSRSMGFATRAVGDFRGDRTLALHQTFFEVVERTPILAGLDANDIFSLDHDRLVERFVAAGSSGIGNLPSSQMFGDEFRAGAGATPRHGMHQEAHLIAVAHERGLFAFGVASRPDDALLLVDSGADLIIATCGHTAGGTAGYPDQTYDDAVRGISAIVSAVRERDAGVFSLGHGGPFNSAQSTEVLYERTDVDGFFGGSAFDRIPIERGVTTVLQAYKAPWSEYRAS